MKANYRNPGVTLTLQARFAAADAPRGAAMSDDEQSGAGALPADRTGLRWIVSCGWKGRCPHCGEGPLFKAWLKLAERCEHCRLSYGFASPDDGPAFFSLCVVALPLIFVVVWLQVAFEPPWWVHLLTSFPLLIAGCLLPLRPIKGWLVASQYVNKAQEARPVGPAPGSK
jgi:uncharacterized protein (DUF983 family)